LPLYDPHFLSLICLFSNNPPVVSGKGIITQTLARQRIQKLNSDLERVRELQQQLDVLRAVQKNKLCATPGLTEEEPQKKRESIGMQILMFLWAIRQPLFLVAIVLLP